MTLRRTLFHTLAGLAAFTLAPMAAQAQEDAAVQQATSAHERLFATMENGLDREEMLVMTTGVVATQIIATLPADMTAGKPDLQQRLAQALLPAMRVYSGRVTAEYRPRMIAAIAEVFTADEADVLAEFYSSDLGRRALSAASSNLSVDAMTADGMDDMRVEAASVERDIAETGMRAFGAMSQADRAELMRVTLSNPAFLKMPQMQQRIAQVRAEMESAPLTAEETAMIQQAVASVLLPQ